MRSTSQDSETPTLLSHPHSLSGAGMSVAGGRIVDGVGYGAEGVLDMGKASRQRRLNKEKERQRQRAARDTSPRGPSRGSGPGAEPGPGYQPSQKELVASLISEAVAAVCHGDQDAYGVTLRQLADERTPAWTQAISRSLVEFLRVSVTAAWRRGWQPAELARHVGRELSGEHVPVVADMIADEMRGYAAATVDTRWASQVTALSAASPETGTSGHGAW